MSQPSFSAMESPFFSMSFSSSTVNTSSEGGRGVTASEWNSMLEGRGIGNLFYRWKRERECVIK